MNWYWVLFLIVINGVEGLIYKDWFPGPMEKCLIDRSRGVSPRRIPAFDILFECKNYQVAYNNVNNDVISPVTEDNERYFQHLGRRLQGLESEYKRRKRSAKWKWNNERKEIRTMTNKQLDDYFAALNALKKDGSYDAITRLHQQAAIMGAHFGPGFLGWHRIYNLVLQLAIWDKNPRVMLPYCDTTLDHNMKDPKKSVLFGERYFGNLRGAIKVGPFKNWNTTANVILQRDGGRFGSFMTDEGYKQTMSHKHMREVTLGTSLGQIERQHNNPHVYIGGLMSDLNYAPCDPFFFCHHNYIDYVWEQFRENQRRKNVDPGRDYPNNTMNLHEPDTRLPMIADYLKVNLTQADCSHNMFSDKFLINFAKSPKYPNCGNYPHILRNDSRKVCYSVEVNPAEVDFLERMRSSEKKFKVSHGFVASVNDERNSQKNIFKRSAVIQNVSTRKSNNVSPGNQPIQNDFLLNGIVSSKNWAYIPVRIVYKRPPNCRFNIGTAKYQRAMEEKAEHKRQETLHFEDGDLYDPRAYPRLWKKLREGNPASFGDFKVRGSGESKIFVETTGLSYKGDYKEYAIVDERQPISEAVAYVALKRPSDGETVQTFVTAFDPNGRVCEAHCHVKSSNPPKYERCSGVININSKEPKMYGDNLGDAYLLRYRFQGDNLPSSHDGDVFLMFFCNYGKRFPWEKTYNKK
ncbi:uncharacterized protein LOC127718881 [Mytilus californianus]|uniref:uncharacterized protein LOC127718881 n=1 Tax=Mytilus californianus TaxID=6549 RepID=UPI002246F450|nr:uncharacterized protein LOC127718881 [Mytilus californianus]